MTRVRLTRGTRWLGAAGWLCAGILLLSMALPARAENVADAWRSAGTPTFNLPWSVSVNPTDGSCWVADYGNNQVVHLAADGTQLWRSAGAPTFRYPWSVSVNQTDGSCWVADTYNHKVVHLAPDGTQLWRGGSFSRTWCVSVNSTDGSCWVIDYDNNQIVHLGSDGTELWRSPGSDAFSYPWSLRVDPSDGSCWVADTYHGQIVHLGSDGTELARISGFSGPCAVAPNPKDGSCWVADTGANQIVHLSRDGSQLFRSSGTSAFARPFDVSVNPADGSCWVSDSSHNQIVHLAEDGTQLWRGGRFNGPGCLSVDPNDGSCWVADYTDNQVVRLVPTTFSDVPPTYWAFAQINACFEAGLVNGYPDGTYQPASAVTRDQMAVYISRAIAGGDAKIVTAPATASFPDVPVDYWAFKYVEYAKAKNIVTGYPDGTYGPTDPVDRGQMAIYIARAVVDPTGDAGLVSYTPPTTPSFPDVGTDYYAYKYIEYIKSKDIAAGYPDKTYQPAVVVTRDQMAVYIARAFQLPL